MTTKTTLPDYDDWITWINSTPVPVEQVQFFQEHESTKNIVNHPRFRAVPTPSRVLGMKEDNAFFAKTLNGPSVVSQWLLLIQKDYQTPPISPKGSISLSASPGRPTTRPLEESDCIFLLHLGPDLDGFVNTTHGGVLSALLDEALSLCVEFHRQLTSEGREPLYTVQLNVTFCAAAQTPGVVVLRTWLEAREGRKWLLKGQICDVHNQVLTAAEGIWVTAKPKI